MSSDQVKAPGRLWVAFEALSRQTVDSGMVPSAGEVREAAPEWRRSEKASAIRALLHARHPDAGARWPMSGGSPPLEALRSALRDGSCAPRVDDAARLYVRSGGRPAGARRAAVKALLEHAGGG